MKNGPWRKNLKARLKNTTLLRPFRWYPKRQGLELVIPEVIRAGLVVLPKKHDDVFWWERKATCLYTVVYYNILGSGELVFFLPKKHITSHEASWLNLQHGYTFEKDYRFSVRDFQSNLPDVVAFVARLLDRGFVPEGHNGPFKPERGATHFWTRPYDAEAGAAAKRARVLSGSLNELSRLNKNICMLPQGRA